MTKRAQTGLVYLRRETISKMLTFSKAGNFKFSQLEFILQLHSIFDSKNRKPAFNPSSTWDLPPTVTTTFSPAAPLLQASCPPFSLHSLLGLPNSKFLLLREAFPDTISKPLIIALLYFLCTNLINKAHSEEYGLSLMGCIKFNEGSFGKGRLWDKNKHQV